MIPCEAMASSISLKMLMVKRLALFLLGKST